MLKTDSDEFTDRIVVKRLPPNRVSVAQLAKQTGIPRDTRYGWRARSGARGGPAGHPGGPGRNPEQRDPAHATALAPDGRQRGRCAAERGKASPTARCG